MANVIYWIAGNDGSLQFAYRFHNIDGLMQNYSISSALAMEVLLSCTKPSIYIYIYIHVHKNVIANALELRVFGSDSSHCCFPGIENKHPIQCAPCVAMLCFDFVHDIGSQWMYVSSLPISFRVASLVLGQSWDCPSAGEVSLQRIWIRSVSICNCITNANLVRIILGKCCKQRILISLRHAEMLTKHSRLP